MLSASLLLTCALVVVEKVNATVVTPLCSSRGGLCQASCFDLGDSCKDNVVDCPADSTCEVLCTRGGTCRNTVVLCPSGGACRPICETVDNCVGLRLLRPTVSAPESSYELVVRATSVCVEIDAAAAIRDASTEASASVAGYEPVPSELLDVVVESSRVAAHHVVISGSTRTKGDSCTAHNRLFVLKLSALSSLAVNAQFVEWFESALSQTIPSQVNPEGKSWFDVAITSICPLSRSGKLQKEGACLDLAAQHPFETEAGVFVELRLTAPNAFDSEMTADDLNSLLRASSVGRGLLSSFVDAHNVRALSFPTGTYFVDRESYDGGLVGDGEVLDGRESSGGGSSETKQAIVASSITIVMTTVLFAVGVVIRGRKRDSKESTAGYLLNLTDFMEAKPNGGASVFTTEHALRLKAGSMVVKEEMETAEMELEAYYREQNGCKDRMHAGSSGDDET